MDKQISESYSIKTDDLTEYANNIILSHLAKGKVAAIVDKESCVHFIDQIVLDSVEAETRDRALLLKDKKSNVQIVAAIKAAIRKGFEIK